VPRQHVAKKDGEGAPASAAPAAVRAKHALATVALAVDAIGIVARETAVPVQRAASAAVRAALLLERKSSACNAGSSATNRTHTGRIPPLLPEPDRPAERFLTALAARLGSAGDHKIKKRRHWTALLFSTLRP
jgi:hypothetical protein